MGMCTEGVGVGKGPGARSSPLPHSSATQSIASPARPGDGAITRFVGARAHGALASRDRLEQLCQEFRSHRQELDRAAQGVSPRRAVAPAPASAPGYDSWGAGEGRARDCEKLLEREKALRDFALQCDAERKRLQQELTAVRLDTARELEQYRELMLRLKRGDAGALAALVAENRRLAAELQLARADLRAQDGADTEALSEVPSYESELLRVKRESYGEQRALKQEVAALRQALQERSEELAAARQRAAEGDEGTAEVLAAARLHARQQEARVGELRQLAEERGTELASLAAQLNAQERRGDAAERGLAQALADLERAQGKAEQLRQDNAALQGTVESMRSDAAAVSERLHEELQLLRDDSAAARHAAAEAAAQRDAVEQALRAEADELRAQLEESIGATKSRMAVDVEAMMVMQGNAQERDEVILQLRAELGALRGRFEQATQEKEILMTKLVEERAAAERDRRGAPPRSERSSASGASEGHCELRGLSALAARDAAAQTAEEPDPALAELDAQPSGGSIEALKQRIGVHAAKCQELQEQLRHHDEVLGLLRATLQRKLHDEMDQLTRERSAHLSLSHRPSAAALRVDGGSSADSSPARAPRQPLPPLPGAEQAERSVQEEMGRLRQPLAAQRCGSGRVAPRSASSSPVDLSSGTDSLWPSPRRDLPAAAAPPPAARPARRRSAGSGTSGSSARPRLPASAVAAAAGLPLPDEGDRRISGLSGGSFSGSDGPPAAQEAKGERAAAPASAPASAAAAEPTAAAGAAGAAPSGADGDGDLAVAYQRTEQELRALRERLRSLSSPQDSQPDPAVRHPAAEAEAVAAAARRAAQVDLPPDPAVGSAHFRQLSPPRARPGQGAAYLFDGAPSPLGGPALGVGVRGEHLASAHEIMTRLLMSAGAESA